MAKKRANGEGNIRKRNDGRWEGRYIKGRTPDGKAKLGYVYGKTYGQVRQRLVQYRAQCGELILSAENPTFGQLAQDWLNSLGSSVKKSTAAHYGYTLRRYLLPQLQELRLHSLEEHILEAALLRIFSSETGLQSASPSAYLKASTFRHFASISSSESSPCLMACTTPFSSLFRLRGARSMSFPAASACAQTFSLPEIPFISSASVHASHSK